MKLENLDDSHHYMVNIDDTDDSLENELFKQKQFNGNHHITNSNNNIDKNNNSNDEIKNLKLFDANNLSLSLPSPSLSSPSSPSSSSLSTYSMNITNNNNNNNNSSGGGGLHSYFSLSSHVTSRQIKLVVIPFGVRILLTALIWDHFVGSYQALLQNYTASVIHRVFMFFFNLFNKCVFFIVLNSNTHFTY